MESRIGPNYGRLALWLLLLCYGPWGPAQAPPTYAPPSSIPKDLIVFGDHLYFTAIDGRHGRELWRVDRSGSPELILDVTPGPTGSEIDRFHVFGAHLYFRYIGKNGFGELWRTDGTARGTVLVYDFYTEGTSDGLLEIVGHSDDHLFLNVGYALATQRVWATDGTVGGTRSLDRDGDDRLWTYGQYHGVVSDGEVYFAAQRGTGLFSALRTNMAQGTVEVLHEFPSQPVAFSRLAPGKVLFRGSDGLHGGELWITEGDRESTRMISDIYRGAESSDPGEFHLVTMGGNLLTLFAATTAEYGRELWYTDGTEEGTDIWYDLFPGPGSSNPGYLKSEGGPLFFVAVGEGAGTEAWYQMLDGSPPKRVGDSNPGVASADPYATCIDKVSDFFFSATEANGDEELWHFVGGSKGRLERFDINPGPAQSYPYYTVAFGESVVTVATGPVVGRELWIVRPNSVPRVFADIFTDTSINPSSMPHALTPAGKLLYFVANDIEHGLELWCSDGSEMGTRLVRDIFPGSASSNPTELLALGDLLYFVAEDGDHGYELWRSDGTTLGTAMLREINPVGSARPQGLVVFKDNLVFAAFRPAEGEELWIVESGKEPQILCDIFEGEGSSSPRDLVVWKDHIYFRASNGLHGEEFWRTDGTKEGTAMVKDIVGAPVERISAMTPAVGMEYLYVAAASDFRGTELWRLDPERPQWQLVRDIATGSAYETLRVPAPVPTETPAPMPANGTRQARAGDPQP